MLRPSDSLLDRLRHWLRPDLPYVRTPGDDSPCPREEWRARVLRTLPGLSRGTVERASADELDARMQQAEAVAFAAARRRQPWWRRALPTRFWR